LRNSADPAGKKTRTRFPSTASIFANSRHGVGRSERVFARNDNVTIRANRQVERDKFGVVREQERLDALAESERKDRIVALAVRTDPRGEKQPPIIAKCKVSRKRHDPRRNHVLARSIKRTGKGHHCASAA
jgi:hypothetical protein